MSAPRTRVAVGVSETLEFRSHFVSHPGNVREINEDSHCDRAAVGVWVVADGMGGHAAGDYASDCVATAFRDADVPDDLVASVDWAEECLERVNQQVWAEGQRRGELVGTTVVALLVRGTSAVVCWIGDSRAYLYRAGRLQQLTHDHTEFQELLEQGRVSAAEEEAHEGSDVLTLALGTERCLVVDMDHAELRTGDILVLCSDGLTKEVADSEIAEILATRGDCSSAAQHLLETALSREASDNITLGVVEVRAAEP